MLKKIVRAIRRAKAAAYVAVLKKQLKRLEARDQNSEMRTRVARKNIAIERARAALAALSLAFLVVPTGCAHVSPTGAIETAVIVSEAALEVCTAKHKADEWDGSQEARDRRESCLQVQDIDRTRDATTALDDAVEAMEHWIKTGT